MEKNRFHCKIEELPVIAGFLLDSLRKDLNDFEEYSGMFTVEYIDSIEMKRKACQQLIMSTSIRMQLKEVTGRLRDRVQELRGLLNRVEGYVRLAGDTLDVPKGDTGMKEVRQKVNAMNAEGIIQTTHTLIATLQRNQAVLALKGMTADLPDKTEEIVQQIDRLNNRQNILLSDYSRLAESNMVLFNDLWDNLSPIMITARSLYRGVDGVKLRDYTMTRLVRRVNAEGKIKAKGEKGE